jgi:hypothetical protein
MFIMKRVRFWTALVGALAATILLLAGCGLTPTANVSPISTPAGNGTSTPAASATSTPEVTVPTQTPEIANLARQDLAQRLNTAADRITVASVAPVDWPDTSLGCPQPGQSYAQVITPGYQIELQVGGREYTYHSGGNRLVLCENGEPILNENPSTPDEMDPEEADLVDQAEEDLVNRIKVAPDSIVLQSVEPVDWPDSSLGCPQPGMNYLMVVTPGYLIKLEAGGKVYEYHTDTQHIVYCQNPKLPLPAEPGSEVDVETRLLDLAEVDLSQQLNIPVDQIQVVQVTAVEWPDASMGCPKAGKMYAQIITPGYQIILSAQGHEYDYHSSLRDVFLCK